MSAKLVCQADGVPRPSIQWLVNGVPVEGKIVWNYASNQHSHLSVKHYLQPHCNSHTIVFSPRSIQYKPVGHTTQNWFIELTFLHCIFMRQKMIILTSLASHLRTLCYTHVPEGKTCSSCWLIVVPTHYIFTLITVCQVSDLGYCSCTFCFRSRADLKQASVWRNSELPSCDRRDNSCVSVQRVQPVWISPG